MAYKPITDQQLRLYMTDLQNHSQRTAAARAGFSERTARRFDADPTPPSNRKIVHGRTVTDPLEGYWDADLLPFLEKDSPLQAVTLLRHLQGLHPLAFPDDRIRRTLERRVRQWRALNGPGRDIIFRQTPEPGLMAQSDFTHAEELEVMIAGQPFAHLLSADLDAGRVPDPETLASRLSPRHTTLPKDVAVVHPSLDSFDALLGACA